MLKNVDLAKMLIKGVNSTTESLMKVGSNIHPDPNLSDKMVLPFFIFNEYGIIGGICSLIALILATHQIVMHLYFFNEPKLQLYIVRILLMVPIYSVQSWLSLIMPKYSVALNTLRDCYEAYVLYIFLQLLIQYLRGEENLINQIERDNKKIEHLFPLDSCYRKIIVDRFFFRKVKQGVMQFVLIKPLTSILAVILIQFNIYKEGDFSLNQSYIYISFINNISVSISLYCLVLFYIGFEEKLQPFRPLSKFLCIKFVIFFSFWQSCFLIVLTKFDVFEHYTAKFIQDMLICLEMVFAAIAHSFAFSYKDFIDYSKLDNPIFRNLGRVLNVKDLIDDAENTFIKNKDDEDRQLEEIALLKEKKVENIYGSISKRNEK